MIELYTDGARKMTGLGGWACVIHTDKSTFFYGGFMKDITNNQSELQSVIEGLARVININELNFDVNVYSDSSYFVHGFREWMSIWEKRNWTRISGPKNVQIKNLDQWKLLFEYNKKIFKITANWVRGHNGHPENELCDRIANYCRDHKCDIDGRVVRDSIKLEDIILSDSVIFKH